MQANDLQAVLEAYCAGPEQLRAALSGLAEADFDLAPDEGGWSIRETVHHLVDGDDLWQVGLLAALGGAEAFDLAWYWRKPQEAWAQAWQYAARPIEPALAFFAANRQRAAGLLRLVPAALERQMTVNWPSRGSQALSVREILEMQTRHVAGHSADIRRIRLAKGV